MSAAGWVLCNQIRKVGGVVFLFHSITQIRNLEASVFHIQRYVSNPECYHVGDNFLPPFSFVLIFWKAKSFFF